MEQSMAGYDNRADIWSLGIMVSNILLAGMQTLILLGSFKLTICWVITSLVLPFLVGA